MATRHSPKAFRGEEKDMPRPRKGSLRCGFLTPGRIGFLFTIVLLSPLFSHGQDVASSKAVKPSKDAPRLEPPAFDLTYVPPDAMGVLAVRPNVIFSDPAMRPLARMANEALMGLLPVKIPAALRLPVEEIEQVIGFMTIAPNKGEPKGVHSSTMGLVMIRAAHDYDWQKLMRQLDPKTEEIHRDGHVFYKSKLNLFPEDRQGTIVYCALPDKRTLVLLPPAVCIALFTGKPAQIGNLGQRPSFFWDKDWKHVERGLVAVAMDNRWTRGLSAEQIGGETWTKTLSHNASTMVAGVEWKEGIDFHAYLVGKDRAAADQMAKDIKGMLAKWRHDLEQAPQDVPKDERRAAAFTLQMYKDLLEHARVERRESTVSMQATAKVNLADFVKCLFISETGTIPPK
ncbi:MAG TPA: hypothetical protein VH682_29995 [Gemmataceae bacterium]|jgi:hypothetical protein